MEKINEIQDFKSLYLVLAIFLTILVVKQFYSAGEIIGKFIFDLLN